MTKSALEKREELIKRHREHFLKTTLEERNAAAAKVESYFAGTNPVKPTDKELVKI